MRTPTTRFAVTGLALTLFLAACTGNGPADDTGTTEAPDDPGTDDPGGDDQDTQGTSGETVQLRNINFVPAELSVAVGTTVTFVNEDLVRHTVTSGEPGDPDGRFDHSLDSQGEEVEITFDEPGTFVYFCDLHRNMTGTVTVDG